MKKKLLIIVIAVSFWLISDIKAASPTIYVDGNKTQIKGEIINDRTFVSLKSLCTELKCKFGYKNKEDKAKKIVTIYTNLDRQVVDELTASTALIEIQYKLGSNVYQPYVTIEFEDIENRFTLKPIKEVKSTIKGSASQIPYFGTSGSGDLYVPIRFIANGLGRKVQWDGTTKSVYIDTVKPTNYEHLLVNDNVKFGQKVDKSKISSELTNGQCLTAIASENGIVSNNSTLLSFVGNNTANVEDGNYKISHLYTSSTNHQFYGSFANICSTHNNGESTKVVSITTPNYFPYIQVHEITNKIIDDENIDQGEEVTVEETRNLINVPIDSRPVSRSKFSNLVTAAGYNYLEVTEGITDYVNNNQNNSWVLGNSSATRNQLTNLVSTNNTSDTSVIINTTSYLFGGLGASRSPILYNDLSALDQLQNLVSTYNEPTYYITAVLPRVLPEQRVDDWSWPIKVGGLKYYINGENNENYKITYPEALVEWYYLKYMNEATNSYNSWPSSVKKFYNNFYTWYAGGEKTDWEYQTYNSNVVKPWEYENMYKQFYEMYKKLLSIQNVSNSELIILVDDYELPSFIASNQDKYDWILKDVNGDAIKYSVAYDILQKIEKDINNNNRSKVNIIYGTDEVNYLLLARDLVKNDGSKIKLDVNYSDNSLKNYVGYYDKMSVENLIQLQTEFINYYGNDDQEKVNMYVVKASNKGVTNADKIINKVYNLVNKDKTVMITDISDNNLKMNFLNKLAQKRNQSIFQIPYYGGWGTVGNALGISLSSITVYNDLKQDIEDCVENEKCDKTLTSKLQSRLIAYDKSRLVNVLEDGIYHGAIRDNLVSSSNNIDLDYNNILSDLSNHNTPIKINKYQYYYDNVSYTAYNPWPRTFEVQIEPTLNNMIYK